MEFQSVFIGLFCIWLFNIYLPEINEVWNALFLLIDNIMGQDEDADEDMPALTDIVPTEPKYEDKYLNEMRKLNKEWDFTEDELETEKKVYETQFNETVRTLQTQLEEYKKEISVLEKELVEDIDTIDSMEIQNEEGTHEFMEDTTLEERNEYRKDRIAYLREEMKKATQELENTETISKYAQEGARAFIIKARIDRLNNNFVMEKTPLGNVLMIYDKERESFKYYADSSVPYRYLEPVARKYVKIFNCRPLFVDMEEELKLVEQKWTKEYELKKIKEAEEKKRAVTIEKKSSVFAKFKSYNKDAGGKISMAAPPKNSIPKNNVPETKENEKILLKERANRYTYEGKLANFNFLQKVERKVFNKKLALTFSDFKKMQKK